MPSTVTRSGREGNWVAQAEVGGRVDKKVSANWKIGTHSFYRTFRSDEGVLVRGRSAGVSISGVRPGRLPGCRPAARG
jgi:hypothetical protein